MLTTTPKKRPQPSVKRLQVSIPAADLRRLRREAARRRLKGDGPIAAQLLGERLDQLEAEQRAGQG